MRAAGKIDPVLNWAIKFGPGLLRGKINNVRFFYDRVTIINQSYFGGDGLKMGGHDTMLSLALKVSRIWEHLSSFGKKRLKTPIAKLIPKAKPR